MPSNIDSSIEAPCPENVSKPLGSNRSKSPATRSVPFDRDLQTRNICALAILFGWLASICSIALGVHMVLVKQPLEPYFSNTNVLIGTTIYCYSGSEQWNRMGHITYAMPKGIGSLITMITSVAVTILVDSMAYVHSTTLRWALIREGRLQKNSNLRLFSSAKSHFSNKWYMNVISLLSLSIMYGSMALLVTTGDVVLECSDFSASATSFGKEVLDFNSWGVMGLGVGLLLQCLICTFSLYNSAIVATWSSHPMINARAYSWWSCRSETPSGPIRCDRTLPTKKAIQSLLPKECYAPQAELKSKSSVERALSSGHSSVTPQSQDALPSRPQTRQQCMLAILPGAWVIRYTVWAYFGAFALWSSILGIVGHATHTLSHEETSANGTASSWESSAMIDFYYPTQDFPSSPDWVGLLIQIAVQSFIVLGLHCIELIANTSRDESLWRRAASVGVNMNESALRQFLTSWQSMMLMVLKSVTQWVFGKAFIADICVEMSLFPLATTAGLFLVSAVFTNYLVRRKPKGYQPVTYGEIGRLAHFIDEWDETRIFWGDKGEIGDGIRRAGTAGHQLCDIHPEASYMGLAYT